MSKKTVKKHIKSAIPIYGAAVIFFVMALVLPIYKMWAILAAGAVAAGGWYGLTLKFPGRDEITEVEVLTGDEELDRRILNSREILQRFRAAAEQSGDANVRANIIRIANAADGIVDEVIEDKSDRGDAFTFFEYYRPTLDTLLGYYTNFALTDKGENAVKSRARIEGCLGMVAEAFEKFLDKLYHNEAVSIKASVDVLKTMLRTDGLAGKDTAVSDDPVKDIESISSRLQEEATREKGITAVSN